LPRVHTINNENSQNLLFSGGCSKSPSLDG
jgi:hypothetical protein